jgi:hypothetical protein
MYITTEHIHSLPGFEFFTFKLLQFIAITTTLRIDTLVNKSD